MASYYERELRERLGRRSLSRKTTLERLRAAESTRVPTHTFKAALDGSCIYDGLPELAPVHERATDTNGEVPTGVMIALFPAPHVAHQLALTGGEAPEELHVTLAFLGRKTDLGDRYDDLKSVVANFAKDHGPLSGEVSGLGLFTAGPKPVTYASVDVPGLPHFRQELVKALEAAGFVVSNDHGYTPHMTLAYDDRRGHNPKNLPLSFGAITLAAGGERSSYDLAGVETARKKTTGEKTHEYKHPAGGSDLADESKFTPPCDYCNLPADDLIHMALGDPESDTPIDMNDDGVADNYKTTARPFRKGGPKYPTPAPVGAAVEGEVEAGKLMQGIDACIDQAIVLLRSINEDIMPPYALQARDMLNSIEESCDAMLAYFGVSDADEASDPEMAFRGIRVIEPAPVTAVPVVVEPTEPTQRAFISEVNGHTFLTGPADLKIDGWEKAGSPNEYMMWMQGRFVAGEEANRNGAFWSTQDLEFGQPTVANGPLNWLHEARHIIGTIADAKLVLPNESAADAVKIPHINALANIWCWIYPDEADVITMASDSGKLWYSMECISKNVECVGEGGCGQKASYMDYLKNASSTCAHMRERSATRRFAEPTFLGGAVIVPPVRPGWADADARVMREAAALAEQSFDLANPNMTATEWEILMSQLVKFAQ